MGNRSHAMRKIGFDAPAFIDEVERAARGFGMTLTGAAREAGVSAAVVSRMRSGETWGDAAAIAALGAWSGVNPSLYAIDRRCTNASSTSLRPSRARGAPVEGLCVAQSRER